MSDYGIKYRPRMETITALKFQFDHAYFQKGKRVQAPVRNWNKSKKKEEEERIENLQ